MLTSPASLIRWSSVSALTRSIAAGLRRPAPRRSAGLVGSRRRGAAGARRAGAHALDVGGEPVHLLLELLEQLRRERVRLDAPPRCGFPSGGVSSPRRIAPAMRALPFSVCRARRSDCETFSSAGFAFQSRRSAPIAARAPAPPRGRPAAAARRCRRACARLSRAFRGLGLRSALRRSRISDTGCALGAGCATGGGSATRGAR